MQNQAKAIVALLIPLVVSLATWWATGTYDAEEILLQIIAIVNYVSVYLTPNKTDASARRH